MICPLLSQQSQALCKDTGNYSGWLRDAQGHDQNHCPRRVIQPCHSRRESLPTMRRGHSGWRGDAQGHDPASHPCRVTPQRHPATSSRYVILPRHPATSSLQRHPATSFPQGISLCCARCYYLARVGLIWDGQEMPKGMTQQVIPATSFSNVIPATSSCHVTLPRHPATSSCNVIPAGNLFM